LPVCGFPYRNCHKKYRIELEAEKYNGQRGSKIINYNYICEVIAKVKIKNKEKIVIGV
jgi:hypothetical protein